MSEGLEIRSNEMPIADVSYPKRTVTVVVAPYERPTVIGDAFTEIVSRGAYDGVQRRAGKILSNRDHNWERLAGRVVELYPERDEGLVADVKLYDTPIGKETLEICADGGLFASAGFRLMREGGETGPVKRNAESWENRHTVRRLNHLRLDHVAFVPNPAYDDAVIQDVRREQIVTAAVAAAAELTPNLDALQVEELRARMLAIDVRYGV